VKYKDFPVQLGLAAIAIGSVIYMPMEIAIAVFLIIVAHGIWVSGYRKS
jgi:hypothetical protein